MLFRRIWPMKCVNEFEFSFFFYIKFFSSWFLLCYNIWSSRYQKTRIYPIFFLLQEVALRGSVYILEWLWSQSLYTLIGTKKNYQTIYPIRLIMIQTQQKLSDLLKWHFYSCLSQLQQLSSNEVFRRSRSPEALENLKTWAYNTLGSQNT